MADNDNHAKILRAGQYVLDTGKYVVQAPRVFKKAKEQEVDESTKRIEDLREEIRKIEEEITVKLEKSEKDAEEIVDKAELEAERIVGEAEKSAFDRVKKSVSDKDTVLLEQKTEAEKVIDEAKSTAELIVAEARQEAEKIKAEARREGFEQGRDEGFEAGKEEIVSMTGRLKSIVEVTLKEREKILVHSERQILNLVLSMVRKVVKKLTEEEKNVVINNTQEALSIIRGAMKVYIHVNPQDYEYTTRHKDELIRLIEGMPEVKFFEDPTVDRGGVFIETDLGEVDARVASQLEEIEDKIKFYIPMKVKGKGLETGSTSIPEEVKQADVIPM